MCFQNGGRPPSWIFVELKFRGISVSGTSVLVSEPYFVRICAIATELWPFKWIFKMAAVRHLELLFGILDHPRSFLVDLKACVQISCRSDLYLRRYLLSNISQVWLKMPIYVLGGFWPLNITFHHRNPQKALPWRKTRAMSHRASKSVQRCGQDAVRRIQKNKGRTKNSAQLGIRPAHPLIPICTIFSVLGGTLDLFLKFGFQNDRSRNFGAVGVEVRHFPLTSSIVGFLKSGRRYLPHSTSFCGWVIEVCPKIQNGGCPPSWIIIMTTYCSWPH